MSCPSAQAEGRFFACGTFAYAICWGGSVAAVVWADRIRPQHKAPPFGVLRAGSTARRPLQGVCHPSWCFLKSGVTGGFYPPLRVRWKPCAYSNQRSTPPQPRFAQQLLIVAPAIIILKDSLRSATPQRWSQGVLTFSVCEPVPGQYRTGRVREPMYWYKPCALLSGGTAARADSIRPYWSTSFKTSSL